MEEVIPRRTLPHVRKSSTRKAETLRKALQSHSERLADCEKNRLESFERGGVEESGRVVAELVHSLKNPLGALRNTMRWLSRDDLDPRRRRRYVDVAMEAIQTMSTRLDQILRPEEGCGQDVDLGSLLRAAVESVSLHYPQVRIEVPEIGERITIMGSKRRIEAVISSLLVNACQACGDSGSVGIEIQRDGDLLLSVDDDGCGFPDDVLVRLGEPHLTTRPDGNGLGLYLAIRYLHSIGGDLRVKNLSKRGARVTMVMPCPRS